MKRKMKRILGVQFSFMLIIGLMSGMGITAKAVSVEDATWSENKNITENTGIGKLIITNDITGTIAEGVTVTVYDGIDATGYTFTIDGMGTLIVKSRDGSDGNNGAPGEGRTGEPGFKGNIIVDGATVDITGGKGGNGIMNGHFSNPGGKGGVGVEGNVTVNSGTIVVTGGNSGFDASSGDYGFGFGAKGVNGNVTVNGGTAVVTAGTDGLRGQAVSGTISGATKVESNDNSTWSDITGTTSSMMYVKVDTPVESEPSDPEPTTPETSVPYEEVPISTGYVKDITGTAAATAESNPFGTKIENNNDLQNVLGIEDADVAQGVNVWLDIQDNSANVPEAEKTLVEAASEDYTVGLFLDINLFMKVGNNAAMKVASTSGKVKASIVIPESLWKSGRTFEIIRVHDGEATAIAGTYDENTHVFTFETDKFSTYALAYKDTETASSGSSSSSSTVSYPKTTPVYRLFNTKNGQHFYTANKEEHDILVAKGWNDEGIAWQVRAAASKPVYRLFDKSGTGRHLFTSDAAIRDSYIAKGWADEGIAWYAEAANGRVVYKLTKGDYELLTTSAAEKDALAAAGFTASEADFKVN